MRKFLLIILTSIHLFGNTEISQLLRIPNLIHHYLEHCRLEPGIGFTQFLSMHYGGNDGTSADDEKDQQLPCHNPHHNSLSVVCFKLQDAPSIESVTTYESNDYTIQLISYHSQEHIFSFFQPPRLA
jgi:hypothetical protein